MLPCTYKHVFISALNDLCSMLLCPYMTKNVKGQDRSFGIADRFFSPLDESVKAACHRSRVLLMLLTE